MEDNPRVRGPYVICVYAVGCSPRTLAFGFVLVLCGPHSRRAMLRLTAPGGDAFSTEKMRAAFDMVDIDKSGYLDAAEVLKALRKLESDLDEVRRC